MSAIPMRVSVRYGSHVPVLLQACLKTRGPILECGAGVFSTGLIHWLGQLHRRRVVTLENNAAWFESWASQYAGPHHEVIQVSDWAMAPIEGAWDVALVDCTPDSDRAGLIERLAHTARYILAHDANKRYYEQFGYGRVFHTFKYRGMFRGNPRTAILSNLGPLDDFWKGGLI